VHDARSPHGATAAEDHAVVHAAGVNGQRRFEELEHVDQAQFGPEMLEPRDGPSEQGERVLPDVLLERSERREDQAPLVHGPAEVAAGRVVAVAGEGQGLGTGQPGRAGPEARPGERVAHGIRDRELDLPHLGRHPTEILEPREEVRVDPDAREPFDRLHHELRAAEEERRVDLLAAHAGDRHVRVSRDPQDRRGSLPRIDPDDVKRVGSRPGDRLARASVAPDRQHEQQVVGGNPGPELGLHGPAERGRQALARRRTGRDGAHGDPPEHREERDRCPGPPHGVGPEPT
jgi:hypothetical protein